MRQSYYYDHRRDRKLPALPDEIPHGNGIRRRPHISDEQYRDYGIITTPVELLDVPDGYMIDPATFRIEYDADLNTAREVGKFIPVPPLADLPPEPSVVVIDFDSKTGEPSGKTYRGMCIDGEFITTQNSASPVLPGTEQLEAAISIKKDRDDLRGRAGKVETAANAAGNSVPALRAVVAELARIVKER